MLSRKGLNFLFAQRLAQPAQVYSRVCLPLYGTPSRSLMTLGSSQTVLRRPLVQHQAASFAKGKKEKGSKKKTTEEKKKVREEFEGQEIEDVKGEYAAELEGCQELLEDSLSKINSGRASPQIFSDLEVKAYGEMYPFGDLATTVVQGNNLLLVKVFDESVKEEILKALQRSQFELSVHPEGKDIRVKLGASRKEHIDAALKKVKETSQQFSKDVRQARGSALQVLKKLSKILPSDEIKYTKLFLFNK